MKLNSLASSIVPELGFIHPFLKRAHRFYTRRSSHFPHHVWLQLMHSLLVSGTQSSSQVFMLLASGVLLRRGKPRPRAGMFPDKYRRVPTLLKPQQGGQQYFNDFLLSNANEALARESVMAAALASTGTTASLSSGGAAQPSQVSGFAGTTGGSIHARLPQVALINSNGVSSAEVLATEMRVLKERDNFSSGRGFNDREWYEQEVEQRRRGSAPAGTEIAGTEESGAGIASYGLPPRVLGTDYFESRFGYSLVKRSEMNRGVSDYAQTELWGEMPSYSRDMVFLYLISRRRNTYAVAYSYEGKRLLTTYTAGNRGLKGGDRGFRADGSTDNGHQVTSMYLNDLLPKIRELRASEGRPMGRGDKVQLVVRVMGFYNGRQGAVRAVQDRSGEFVVRYLEDITPFPLNGPRMPRGVFK